MKNILFLFTPIFGQILKKEFIVELMTQNVIMGLNWISSGPQLGQIEFGRAEWNLLGCIILMHGPN